MSEQKLVSIHPGRSDAELAEEIRAELTVALGAAIDIMNRANAAGLQVSWSVGRDQFGRNSIQALQIMRML